MRTLLALTLAATLLAPAAAADPVVPVMLVGTPVAEADFLLQWTPAPEGVDGYVVVRTVTGQDAVRISLPPNVQEYVDRTPAEDVVSYVVLYIDGGAESPPSNPVVRSWPHCNWYTLYIWTVPPDASVRPWCLWPPPELPPG